MRPVALAWSTRSLVAMLRQALSAKMAQLPPFPKDEVGTCRLGGRLCVRETPSQAWSRAVPHGLSCLQFIIAGATLRHHSFHGIGALAYKISARDCKVDREKVSIIKAHAHSAICAR